MAYAEGITQEQYNADMASARREGIKEGKTPLESEIATLKAEAAKVATLESQLQALTGERDTLKSSVEQLTGVSGKAAKEAAAVKALAAAGVKPERIEKALKFVPEDADFSDTAKATAAIDAMKADLPEWFGTAQASGNQVPPPNTKPNGSGGSPNPPGDTNFAEQIAAALKAGDVAKSIALKRMAAEAPKT